MRRKAAFLALFFLLAPLAARLAVASSDLETARCALACARAGMGVEKGAACCPTGHGAAVPTMASCSPDDGAAPPPGSAPMLLVAALLLVLPSVTRGRPLARAFALPSAPTRIPDKVPLLLGGSI
ncbi:MAG TPA: hypothetical protein VFA98_00730 [Thermoanaerobaculia bacterium]|nr:hypothetical protein [Thermoanaerobaculia bacterium]